MHIQNPLKTMQTNYYTSITNDSSNQIEPHFVRIPSSIYMYIADKDTYNPDQYFITLDLYLPVIRVLLRPRFFVKAVFDRCRLPDFPGLLFERVQQPLLLLGEGLQHKNTRDNASVFHTSVYTLF